MSTSVALPRDSTYVPLSKPVYDLNHLVILKDYLFQASNQEACNFRSIIPASYVVLLVEDAFKLLKQEPTVLDIMPEDQQVEVIIIGDTHGQFHDVCNILTLMGDPDEQHIFVWNGDFVDRGAWGLEELLLLLALKLTFPKQVFLLRGNHESSTCTRWYGFKGEVDAKFTPAPACTHCTTTTAGLPESAVPVHPGCKAEMMPAVCTPLAKPHPDAKAVYTACKKLFSVLPLAAVIQKKTLVLHGGLFRKPAPVRKTGHKRLRVRLVPNCHQPLELGSLEDLRASGKGGMDPDGTGLSVVAADVLWSDPVAAPGLESNDVRGVGLTFGPDVTQAFLETNRLSLIIRSHEGPDARDRRSDMGQVLSGYSVDHVTEAGNLVTLFSAPDYPQFQDAPTRYNNKGAVAVLSAPDYCQPSFKSFDAFTPRPPARAFYDYLLYADTDEEVLGEEAGSNCMEGSDLTIREEEPYEVVESACLEHDTGGMRDVVREHPEVHELELPCCGGGDHQHVTSSQLDVTEGDVENSKVLDHQQVFMPTQQSDVNSASRNEMVLGDVNSASRDEVVLGDRAVYESQVLTEPESRVTSGTGDIDEVNVE
ncbi:hypothetical protein CEUSTIGMA_g1476.t1 [Chlamydomonas eustigma]|uniref:Serine/threonine-protein phosphatase n=1 Tax=Chlamydomonas eustigma TaxID=1157962 RepID=A0A250WTF3_9CHLO|nr:hypothetical protein CEUSTIGMA_g1476.t1 [Chlamydomonas eustigma]|eukprot:GAX74026.1 hypothetical protein CEUSTIGMA_g1476.t1 [Chlamydomonas eustigma]